VAGLEAGLGMARGQVRLCGSMRSSFSERDGNPEAF